MGTETNVLSLNEIGSFLIEDVGGNAKIFGDVGNNDQYCLRSTKLFQNSVSQTYCSQIRLFRQPSLQTLDWTALIRAHRPLMLDAALK